MKRRDLFTGAPYRALSLDPDPDDDEPPRASFCIACLLTEAERQGFHVERKPRGVNVTGHGGVWVGAPDDLPAILRSLLLPHGPAH